VDLVEHLRRVGRQRLDAPVLLDRQRRHQVQRRRVPAIRIHGLWGRRLREHCECSRKDDEQDVESSLHDISGNEAVRLLERR